MNKVVQLRNEKNITQAELANIAGITQACLSYIEAGKRTGNIKTMQRIADALGVKIDDLIERRQGDAEGAACEGPGSALRS